VTDPAWLRRQQAVPFAPEDLIAVAVVHDEHWHAGLLYADDHDEVHLLHLAFHHRLRRDQGFEPYAFVVPALDLEVKQNVAAMCERVWTRNRTRGLAYGLRFNATTFDATGQVRYGPDEAGLTCATFPLAVFASAGRALVDLTTWETRADDRAAHETLLALLRRYCGDQKHLAAVEKQVGCHRVRPEEAAGTCSAPDLPCSFDLARAAGEQIRTALASAAA